MLHCVMLIALCYVTLHYVTLCYVALRYVNCVMLCYIMLHCIMLCYIMLHCIMLHCIMLRYVMLHFISLHFVTSVVYVNQPLLLNASSLTTQNVLNSFFAHETRSLKHQKHVHTNLLKRC